MGIIGSFVAALVILMATSPWWATILQRHGLEPFLSATDTGSPLALGPFLRLTVEPILQSTLIFAVIGAIWELRRRDLFLPIWLVLIPLVAPRTAHRESAIPVAMLAALALLNVVLPTIRRYSLPSWSMGVGFVVLFVPNLVFTRPALQANWGSPLPKADRVAMEWVRTHTPEGTRFLVMPTASWGLDKPSEWFPTLTDRISVVTVQGHEWLPGFSQAVKEHNELAKCVIKDIENDVECFEQWEQSTNQSFEYIYTDEYDYRGKLRPIYEVLAADERYESVYDVDGVAIFRPLTHWSAR